MPPTAAEPRNHLHVTVAILVVGDSAIWIAASVCHVADSARCQDTGGR